MICDERDLCLIPCSLHLTVVIILFYYAVLHTIPLLYDMIRYKADTMDKLDYMRMRGRWDQLRAKFEVVDAQAQQTRVSVTDADATNNAAAVTSSTIEMQRSAPCSPIDPLM